MGNLGKYFKFCGFYFLENILIDLSIKQMDKQLLIRNFNIKAKLLFVRYFQIANGKSWKNISNFAGLISKPFAENIIW